ncbi:PDZ domain-containing protein [Paenibacillus shirakamiensis]|uniref:endopeptidase La n=1 Tax=Paenibacillus shirakamiensis TaxID=1265935 RepID=A0ABS4JHH1_9BACL|nr:SepM family pheromone-processing serine protease [Paenibacillus shirakamiensis]MBP2001169.1 PDZ domain-containing protein [Paenibacillus shirakamiensis]
MQQRSSKTLLKSTIYVIIVAILVYVIVYLPTPYMIEQPGTAEEVKPMIKVKVGDPEEKGTFMLTTVSVTYANLALLAMSRFNRQSEIVEKPKDQGTKEYETQQVYYMTDSQSNAMTEAYNLAKVPYQIVPEYVFIVALSKDPAPKGNFVSGDIVREIEGKALTRFEDLSSALRGHKVGDHVQVLLERDGKRMNENVELIPLKDAATGEVRAGLGVSLGEYRKVKANDPNKQVEFASTQIGGPSAGLMFTMEIYNQLTPGDLSKGYRIAGTGTIGTDGSVGPIGGVQFKIVAANREKADLFFVPEKNYDIAKKKADEIGTNMKLISVKKAQDVLDYLSKLPPKSE